MNEQIHSTGVNWLSVFMSNDFNYFSSFPPNPKGSEENQLLPSGLGVKQSCRFITDQ